MGTRRVADRYGKERIRLVRVRRDDERHELRDLTVDVLFDGDYEAAYSRGDNRHVLPTDTMKNTVYALARRESWREPEELGRILARHFLPSEPPPSRVEIRLEERIWRRVELDGAPHPHAFAGPREERRIARVVRTEEGSEIGAGVTRLALLKTTGSAFAGFRGDAFTTLPEAEDRLLATGAEARWSYGSMPREPRHSWERIRDLLTRVFATHDSRSVQHTLQAMGEAVLEEHAEVKEIRLRLPNRHHHVVDLSPFGLDNPDEIYVATDEPYGIIEGEVSR